MGTMNLTEIMDKSVDILRRYIKSIVTYTVGYSFLLGLAMIPLIIVFALILVFTGIGIESAGYVLIGIAGFFSMIVILSVSFSYNIGIIKIASQEFLPEAVLAFDAIKASFKNILKITGIILIAFLAFLPAGGLFGAAGYFGYKALEASDISLGIYHAREVLLICFLVVASLAALFVLLAYMAWFAFSLHAAVIEDKGVIGSIRRSLYLVRNDFWRVLGYTILFSLVVSAIIYALESFIVLIFGLIYLLLTLTGLKQDIATFIAIGFTYARWPVNILSWLVISPLGVIMTSLLYFNQRFKKEGFDLSLKLQAIRKAVAQKALE